MDRRGGTQMMNLEDRLQDPTEFGKRMVKYPKSVLIYSCVGGGERD
jgi:hypothetical protein